MLGFSAAPVWAAEMAWVQLDPQAMAWTKAAIESKEPSLQAAWAEFQKDVEAARSAPLQDIRDKKHPAPSGNPQDYATLSTYVWPNPSTPDGLPWIHKDGVTNPQTQEYDRPKLNLAVRSAAALGLSAYWTGSRPDAERAAAHVRAWFIDPATRMNPHLKFAQFIPGKSQGEWHGIIEMSVVVESYFFDALRVVHGMGALTEDEMKSLQGWFREYLAWLEADPMGKACSDRNNNIATCMELQKAAMWAFVGEPGKARAVLQAFGPERIASQIDARGMMPHEMGRTKSMGYSAKNLNYHLQAALLAKNLGVDLAGYRSPEGTSLRRALDAQREFWTGGKKWEGRQIVDYPWVRSLRGLRMAAWLFEEAALHAEASKLPAPQPGELASDRVNLLYPAR